MTVLHHLAAHLESAAGSRLSLPEYRQIELYTKKKSLAFAEAEDRRDDRALAAVARACLSFMVLDAHLEAAHPGLDGKLGWQKVLALPRDTMTAKLVAEIYRILRIVRAVAVHPYGHVEFADGIVKLGGAINHFSLSLDISTAGLALVESFVATLLDAPRQPYPEAYGEAMLGQYFADIIGEVTKFADEDRVLYQFRQKMPFNRHFRFDCDNPKWVLRDDHIAFVIGDLYRDPRRTPIDFFVVIDNRLHIIPVEALTEAALALADLPLWRARLADGITLPAHFRLRFGREEVVSGQPMT